MSDSSEQQRKQVFDQEFRVDLSAPCLIGDGILSFNEEEKEELIQEFDKMDGVPTFFIPASGSGSRMFQFLFEWSDHLSDDNELDSLVNSMSHLPAVKEFLERADNAWELAQLLLKNVASKPKGLIPFHEVDGQVLTAFQEHLLQVKKLFPDGVKLHFTVQKAYQDEIFNSLTPLTNLTDGVLLSFSEQSEESNALCFDEDQRVFMDHDKPLKRPAGHGALLENLNEIDSDLVFIKNIDNVQHYSKSEASLETWKVLTGLLLKFKSELQELKENPTIERLRALNARYQFLSDSEIANGGQELVNTVVSRPSRVCGMVKNTGEPGGGPYWIHDNGVETKQIIEKAQIKLQSDQQEILKQSTHFNPVFIAMSKTDCSGNSLDLMNFVDADKYFVVHKSHKGNDIYYRELPGLWNGSMGNWNSLFVEIPSEVFSPVKTILDLTKPLHQPQ